MQHTVRWSSWILVLVGCGGVDQSANPPASSWSAPLPLSRYDWELRSSRVPTGAGGNTWSREGVVLDDSGLSLQLVDHATGVHAAEVRTPWHGDYGAVTFHVEGPLGALPPSVVFGAFLYRDDTNELDIELSRWGDAQAPNAQFVVAPAEGARRHRFAISTDTTSARLRIGWEPEGIAFSLTTPKFHHAWRYAGAGRPQPHASFVHLNLWLLDGHELPEHIRPVITVREMTITTRKETPR